MTLHHYGKANGREKEKGKAKAKARARAKAKAKARAEAKEEEKVVAKAKDMALMTAMTGTKATKGKDASTFSPRKDASWGKGVASFTTSRRWLSRDCPGSRDKPLEKAKGIECYSTPRKLALSDSCVQ